MRLCWGFRRARTERALTPPTQRGARVHAERAEILRLIEKLRENRQRLGASADPRNGKVTATIDATLNAQMERLGGVGASRGGHAPAAVPAPTTDAARGLASALPRASIRSEEGTSAVGLLKRLEQRLERIEGRLEHSATGDARAAAAARAPAPEDYTLAGAILGDILSDVLQMISSNSMTGTFLVDNGSAKYTIHFQEGQIIHAETPGMSGEGAFFAAFAAMQGRYFFRETKDISKTKTIEGNTQFLILEALRRIDETGSDGEEGGND